MPETAKTRVTSYFHRSVSPRENTSIIKFEPNVRVASTLKGEAFDNLVAEIDVLMDAFKNDIHALDS